MAIIEYTRAAKCSDCKFCTRAKTGKQTRHRCVNPESPRSETVVRLKDSVCDNWKLSGT